MVHTLLNELLFVHIGRFKQDSLRIICFPYRSFWTKFITNCLFSIDVVLNKIPCNILLRIIEPVFSLPYIYFVVVTFFFWKQTFGIICLNHNAQELPFSLDQDRESEQYCIYMYVLRLSILSLLLQFVDLILEHFPQRGVFVFHSI